MRKFLRDIGRRPVDHLENLGLLSPNLIACHCVWLMDAEMDLLARRGVRVVHNPESNMKLAAGVAPIPDLLARKVAVGLGTDGCASNNNLDLFQEMDSAAKLHKVHRLDPTVMPANVVLEMATLGGARVLGYGKGDRVSGGGQEGGCHHPGVEPAPSSAGLQPSFPLSLFGYGCGCAGCDHRRKTGHGKPKAPHPRRRGNLAEGAGIPDANFGLWIAD